MHDLNKGFINEFQRLFKEIQVLNQNQIAYQKFTFNFTLINQIFYELITNQFTPIKVAARLTPFCASNLSL